MGIDSIDDAILFNALRYAGAPPCGPSPIGRFHNEPPVIDTKFEAEKLNLVGIGPGLIGNPYSCNHKYRLISESTGLAFYECTKCGDYK